jgi:integrase
VRLSDLAGGRQTWRPLLAAAGVPYHKFHAARHTHASRLLIDGVPVPEVARRLGDTQETILRTYSRYLPGAGPARRVPRGRGPSRWS